MNPDLEQMAALRIADAPRHPHLAPASASPFHGTGFKADSARFRRSTDGYLLTMLTMPEEQKLELTWTQRTDSAAPEPYIAFEVFLQAKPPKPGRNEPCPCGSGKKFKKCCGA
jgi:SEC-C motif